MYLKESSWANGNLSQCTSLSILLCYHVEEEEEDQEEEEEEEKREKEEISQEKKNSSLSCLGFFFPPKNNIGKLGEVSLVWKKKKTGIFSLDHFLIRTGILNIRHIQEFIGAQTDGAKGRFKSPTLT